MKNQKFNLIDLAAEAFYTCATFFNDKHFRNNDKNPTRFLLVTDKISAIANANYVFESYFKSEEYEEATQKKVHLFDLDCGDWDYDHSAIKICKIRKFKPISSVSKNHELTKMIAANQIQPTNKIMIDDVVRMAFDEALNPQDFFKFQEVRYEYRVSISLVKNRKVIKTLKCNLGHFTLIQTTKPFDYQETESVEKKATRPSLLNPVYNVDGVDTMVTFNDGNKYYKNLVDMMRI
ncbi:hypothetical protein ABZR37_10275 [Achromobacter ruhlandii]|uniref:hypothetical protein n=1 Tax=Pseudomonadota TaxID=1224 RepID=UPI0015A0B312|nr:MULTISPECIES: hypothetical protein [Pseudomonas]MCS8129800.1 hypothetical protein [Pseudomonas aeruginosa]MCS9139034.1 hypothetical protein [Pseudomonas aeruginosa]MCS9211985.1 hypothetical protein [Pseudomonas aeruginosa]NWC42777.1 hypothetical protein [Pseudomonas tolaasii]WLP05882.1 hypothetical protein Q8015_00280 [Pseudomonas putida]